ncbi:hypothetical protein HYQ44_005840 [Verticillium longisporum]|nr:hypothetical protein HYQ44_005840 [Verticillium longisporum]
MSAHLESGITPAHTDLTLTLTMNAPAPAAPSKTRTKRKSIDRQTKLAHLQLVSKYFDYSNYSLPRAEGSQQPNPYRRAGHSFAEQTDEGMDAMEARPSTTMTSRSFSRHQSRSSVVSNCSTPSLIDDHSDSEVSPDDDYQYHASTSQLWDSFWVAGDQPHDFEDPHHHDHDQPPKTPRKGHGAPKARYPALIPSPHIRRTKKASTINYDDDPLPPKPIEYTTTVQQSTLPAHQPPSLPKGRNVTSVAEKRRTVRAVKSSYSLFPKPHQASYTSTTSTTTTKSSSATSTAPSSFVVPPPRTSSLPAAESPTPKPRKTSRPSPIHTHSAPIRLLSGATLIGTPSPALRTSSSFAMLPRTSTSSTRTMGGSIVSDLTTVKSTLPNFPSTNLADLVHPRSAPLPPCRRAPCEPSSAAPSASFFDFDSSDSESDDGPPIARLVKSRRAATLKPASPRRSGDAPRPRRKSLVAWRAADDTEEHRARDVFGRMFGRGSRGHTS